MDGSMDVYKDKWTDGFVDLRIHGWIHGWSDGFMDECVHGFMNKCVDESMDVFLCRYVGLHTLYVRICVYM